jgi:hypothetical protein
MSGSLSFQTTTTWTVPETGEYNIIAYGSEGGAGAEAGGDGAIIGGLFNLNGGDQLEILTGNAEGSPQLYSGGDGTL